MGCFRRCQVRSGHLFWKRRQAYRRTQKLDLTGLFMLTLGYIVLESAIGNLITQIEAMVEQSGKPEGFDAARWVTNWIERPLAALGGQAPAELLHTDEGRELVSRLLATAQSGAYV